MRHTKGVMIVFTNPFKKLDQDEMRRSSDILSKQKDYNKAVSYTHLLLDPAEEPEIARRIQEGDEEAKRKLIFV